MDGKVVVVGKLLDVCLEDGWRWEGREGVSKHIEPGVNMVASSL